MKIGVVGLGKAGLPLACTIADSGLDVIGVDINRNLINKLSKKENPIPEERDVQEILKKTIGKNFNLSSDPIETAMKCNVHIVIVPLFIDNNKNPDFSLLNQAFTNVAKGLNKGDCVILETTVPPGTTEHIVREWLEKESNLKAGKDFHLAYSPERIMTGYSISRYKEFPKVIAGLTSKCTETAYNVYSRFCSKVDKASSIKTAEFVKVAEGVYRDVNIGLANELFKIAEKMEIDFWEVREKAKHAYCNILEPGIVGGHCIPVYPWFLINNEMLDTTLIKTARILSDNMAKYYADKVDRIAKRGGKVAVVGLSYREGVKEDAYSGSYLMIEELRKRGYKVYGIDPLFEADEVEKRFRIDSCTKQQLENMDAVVLMNKIKEYKFSKIAKKVVDVKNVLRG